MAKENIENLSSEKLKKRRLFASILAGICFGVFIVEIVVMIILLVKGKQENILTLLPGFVLLFFAIYMYIGVKKINKELKGREDN